MKTPPLLLTLAFVFVALNVRGETAISRADTYPDIEMPHLTVVAIEHIEIPSLQTGQVASLAIVEGDSVVKHQSIGCLDDGHAKIAVEMAENELKRAKVNSENETSIQLAVATQAASKHELQYQRFLTDMALAESKSSVKTQSAQMAQAVAKNELERARLARSEYAQSVSSSEIEALRLAHAQTQLLTKQASLDASISSMRAKAEQSRLEQSKSNVVRASAELAAAMKHQVVGRIDVDSRRKQLELAKRMLDKHQFITPIDGTVTKRHVEPGEWVREGEAVASVIHLDTLRAEGFIPLALARQLSVNQPVRLDVKDGERSVLREGRVVFIHPVVDAVSQEVQVWINFSNADHQVRPGMRVTVTMDPDQYKSDLAAESSTGNKAQSEP